MKRVIRSSGLAMAAALCVATLQASAGMVVKNSGATTPNPADFSPTFNGHPNQVGYNHAGSDGMFRETFRTACEKGQKPIRALFTIKVKKLSQGRGGGDNDALAFWDGPAVPVFNTFLWTAADPAGTVKTLSYPLGTLPAVNASLGIINSVNSGTGGDGMGLLADGDFSFSVQDDTSVLEASLEYACGAGSGGGIDPNKKGMTWGVYPHDPVTGTANVACQGQPASPIQSGACDPYNGDTPASMQLPVLCFLGPRPGVQPPGPLTSLLPNPVPNAAPLSDPAFWSGGVIATTPPMSPSAQNWQHRSQVDSYCASQFGPGWALADFHAGQGKGWKFGAYGHVGPAGTQRFWVNIRDQANGNVWDQF